MQRCATIRAFCLVLLLLFSSPSFAQTPSALPAPAASTAAAPAGQDSLRALLDTLSDDKARAEFTARLRALLEAREATPGGGPGEDWVAGTTRSLSTFSSGVLTVVGEIENLPAQLGEAAHALQDPHTLRRIGWAALTVLLALAAAFAAEWLASRLLARPRRAIEARAGDNLVIRLFLILVRAVLLALPILAFAAAAFAVLSAVEMSFVVRLAVVTLVNASVLARAVIALGHAVLSPESRRLRLPPLDDESAAYVLLWVRRFANTLVYGYFVLRAAWILGLTTGAYEFLLDVFGLLVAGMAIVFVLQVRMSVARWLRSGANSASSLVRLRNQFADFWHLLAIAYVVAGYAVWVLDVRDGFGFLARATALSLIAMLAARLASRVLQRAFGMIFRLSPEVRQQYPLLEARANRYLPILKQVFQILLAAFTGLVLLEIWGGSPFAWLASDNGQRLLSRCISIGVVALVALVAWELGTAFAERLIRRHPSSSRLKTLLPFLQNGFRVVLLTLVGLILLSEIGVNIAPLLAGAGVFGLAIGFGAQTLVKDVITGIFILMEDTLSVGDVVEVGAHSGLVEKITIRTVHMRDFDGNVHSIPFSEVQTIKNMSKGFAYAVVDVMVSYRENIDEALKTMAEVAEDMRRSGPLAETIIEPFEVVGVEGLQESAVWLRGRFKTRPLGQWNVKREFYRRIKAAFDARGIEIPLPQRRLFFGTDKAGNAPPLHILTDANAQVQEDRRRVAEAAHAARRPGPHIEEHPGARERRDDEAQEILPTVERHPERV